MPELENNVAFAVSSTKPSGHPSATSHDIHCLTNGKADLSTNVILKANFHSEALKSGIYT